MAECAKLTSKDFSNGSDVKWCPGCGCFPILKGVQKAMADIGVDKSKQMVISGIGCSSRFPYYMSTFGFHTLHGRAPTLAIGAKLANPELGAWIISGDGDCLSIGGNHFIHLMRRNLDVNMLLFNNEIYGLTKGQASPTSKPGTVSKTTPLGSVDTPMKALPMAISAGAPFAARVLDSDIKTMVKVFKQAEAHKGTAFIEILFNCVTFSDGIHNVYKKKDTKAVSTINLVPGQPLLFGEEMNKGFVLDGTKIKVIDVTDQNKSEVLIFDPKDSGLSYMLAQLEYPEYPIPLGVIKEVERPTYESLYEGQVKDAIEAWGEGDLAKTLRGDDFWECK